MTFFQWLATLPASIQLQQLLVYVVFGLLGALFHFIRRKLDGGISGSLYTYIFEDHPGRTFSAFGTFIGSAFTYVYSGAVDGITWPALIGLAVTTGYALDSTINKTSSADKTENGGS